MCLFYYKDIAYSFAFGKKIIPKRIIQYKRKENGEQSKIRNCTSLAGHRTIKIAKGAMSRAPTKSDNKVKGKAIPLQAWTDP
jgi:hypothetical protein